MKSVCELEVAQKGKAWHILTHCSTEQKIAYTS